MTAESKSLNTQYKYRVNIGYPYEENWIETNDNPKDIGEALFDEFQFMLRMSFLEEAVEVIEYEVQSK